MMVRGGGCGPHRDGWGIAFYEDSGCRTFHDPNPSEKALSLEPEDIFQIFTVGSTWYIDVDGTIKTK